MRTALIVGVLHVASAAAAQAGEAETYVRGVVDADAVRDPPRGLSVDETARLEAESEASLVRRGGPLSPARIEVFGLSGARLSARLGALPLHDGADGSVDAAMLPLDVPSSLHIGDTIGLDVYAPSATGARARIVAGSLHTVALTGSAHAAAPWGYAQVAGRYAQSAGDFTYTPAPGAPRLRRDNNDQRRAHLLGDIQWNAPLSVRTTFFGALWRGGIPGFSTAPLRDLRGERVLLGAATLVEHRSGPLGIRATAHHQMSHRATATMGQEDALLARSSGGDARAHLRLWTAPTLELSVEAAAAAGHTGLVNHAFSRRTLKGDVGTHAALHFFGWTARADAGAHVLSASDTALQWGGDIGAQLTRPGVRLFSRVRRAPRLPTLNELYAPAGLVLGNATLRPEVLADAQAGARFSLSHFTYCEIEGLAGRIDEAIVFVNQNAYDIKPVNVGPGYRAGIRAAAAGRWGRHLDTHASARVLTSALDASGGPLPLAPPLLLKSGASVFAAGRGRFGAEVRYRSATAANLFGTLRSDAYTLVDVFAELNLTQRVRLSARVENFLDAQGAEDAYLFPLPGRLFFFGFEVSA